MFVGYFVVTYRNPSVRDKGGEKRGENWSLGQVVNERREVSIIS